MQTKNNPSTKRVLAITLGAATGGILIAVAAKYLPEMMEKTMMGFMRERMKRMKESGRLSPEMMACMESCCGGQGCDCMGGDR